MQNFPPPIIEDQFWGYDDTTPAQLLPKGYFQKLDNVFVSYDKIIKVPGSTSISMFPPYTLPPYLFNGFASYENIAASIKYLVVNINGSTRSQLYESSGYNFFPIGTANITNGRPMYFETANNILFGFNGVDEVDWDGTTYNKNSSGIPKGFYPDWFHNYLFVAKTTAYPNRLYWSNIGAPATFDAANYVDINPGDSDQIMGLGEIQDELLVFKQNTIWSITGWSGASFSATTIATENTNARILGYGCIAPKSIVSTGNDIYYLSMYGNTPHIRSIRKTQLAVTLAGGVISDKIQNTMNGITLSAVKGVEGIFDGRYIYWAIPVDGSTYNNKIIVLDTFKSISKKNIWVWTTMTGKNASHFAMSTIPGSATVYFTDSGTSGDVFKFDNSVHTDNGEKITVDVITRKYWYDLARKSHWKYLYLKYAIGALSQTLEINSRVDGTTTFSNDKLLTIVSNSPGLGPTGQFTLGVSRLGGQSGGTNRTTFKQKIGKLLDVEFKETSNGPLELSDIEIYATVKGLRAN